ncbi:MAG: hypothetical protein VW701_19320, partial [Deltaproteobacteria bacterium]
TGNRVVRVWFRDEAGNLSLPVNESIQFAMQSGIRTNVAMNSVTSEGWVGCFSELYSESGFSISTIQATCNKAYLMMACGDATTLTAAAFAQRSDVMPTTADNLNTPRYANGVWWYFNSKSWGFSPDQQISQGSCDTSDGNPPQRDDILCWHMGGTLTMLSSGWSCGKSTSNSTNHRYIFQKD